MKVEYIAVSGAHTVVGTPIPRLGQRVLQVRVDGSSIFELPIKSDIEIAKNCGSSHYRDEMSLTRVQVLQEITATLDHLFPGHCQEPRLSIRRTIILMLMAIEQEEDAGSLQTWTMLWARMWSTVSDRSLKHRAAAMN